MSHFASSALGVVYNVIGPGLTWQVDLRFCIRNIYHEETAKSFTSRELVVLFAKRTKSGASGTVKSLKSMGFFDYKSNLQPFRLAGLVDG
jgi:hypothetical protein